MRRIPVLRHRDFRLLFSGQAVSVLGDALLPVALAFAVLDGLDGSPGELGLVLAAQVVPMTLLVLPAGVWADRMSRRLLMLVSDLGRAVVQAVTAALLLADAAELWHLIALYGVVMTIGANCLGLVVLTPLVTRRFVARRGFVLSIVAFLVHVWLSADRLPEKVATHFTMDGTPDGWMTRQQHLWFMTGMGIGLPSLIVGAFLIIRKVPARFVPDARAIKRAHHPGWRKTAALNDGEVQ